MEINELLNALAPADSRPKAGALETASGLTPEERALKGLAERERLLQEEMVALARGGADYTGNDGWRRIMRGAGRA